MLKVLLVLCYIIFFVCVPLYDKAYWPEPSKKSLLFKMLGASAFVGIGALGMLIAENKSDYASVMLTGLVLGWVGDLFMHIPHPPGKPRMSVVYIGSAAFLIGHIFYVFAFVKSTQALKADCSFFTVPEIVAFFVIFISFALMLKPVFKFDFANTFMRVGLYCYSVFLIVMLIKACNFGIAYYTSGGENGAIAMAILIVGGILFFVSDLTLGFRLLGAAKGNKRVKTLSLYTYFGAQLLLATSILFIHI